MTKSIQSKLEIGFNSQKGEALRDAFEQSQGSIQEFLSVLSTFQEQVNPAEAEPICKNVKEIFDFYAKKTACKYDNIHELVRGMNATEYIMFLFNLLHAISEPQSFKLNERMDVNFVILEQIAAESIESGNWHIDLFNSITKVLGKLQWVLSTSSSSKMIMFFEEVSQKLLLGFITNGISLTALAAGTKES